MSSPDIKPGSVETQQMRVVAPVGVRNNFLYCEDNDICVFFLRVLSDCGCGYHIRLRVRHIRTKLTFQDSHQA
jgi:hypothetical protein